MLPALPGALEALAACAEIRGEGGTAGEFRCFAAHLGSLPEREGVDLVRQLAKDGSSPAGLATSVCEAVRDIARHGSAAVMQAAVAKLPRDLGRLLAVPSVSLTETLDLHRRFGAVTAADLAAVATLAGLEDSDRQMLALHHRLLELLPSLREGHPRIPLGRAYSIAEQVTSTLRGALPADTEVFTVGSLRRYESTVGDIEVLIGADAPEPAIDVAVRALEPKDIAHRSGRVASVVLADEQVTLRAVTPAEAPFALVHYSGSGHHVRGLQRRASERGWSLSPSGFLVKGGPRPPVVADEAGLYAALDLQFVAPELRHGDDEIARAASHSLPALVEVGDIRGDLHVHTLWSDGRDSVETVAYAARSLGYEYVGITDHSPSCAASRVLTEERLLRQREDVERMRARLPGLTILHGVEVDILPDGSLDFPDRILEGLDIVLASLHDSAGQSPDRLLQRYLSAMRHPLVHVVTHPANRLVGRHAGYPLDYDTLFAVAVETGTVLEIDGAPAHLDLDGHMARRAAAAGVMLSVDSDCHNAARLGRQMVFGVGTARRGGLEARHVLNTRPVSEVLGFLARKRGGPA